MEHQAEILIPVPSPVNGVIIVGAQTISYHACKLGISSKSIAMHTTAMNTYGIVNDVCTQNDELCDVCCGGLITSFCFLA